MPEVDPRIRAYQVAANGLVDVVKATNRLLRKDSVGWRECERVSNIAVDALIAATAELQRPAAR